MKAIWEFVGSSAQLVFSLDSHDYKNGKGQGGMKVGLKSNYFNIQLPVGNYVRPHPDLLAFAALVALRPWIHSELQVGSPVSPDFAKICWELFRVSVHPIDPKIKVRAPGNRPLISFSGGVDSIAASEVFPDQVPYIYYKRVNHPDLHNEAPDVRVDAITDVVEKVKKAGKNVYIVESDLEHICSPYPTLPGWFCIGIGALLLADSLDAGLLVMGGTFETYFMDMGKSWFGTRGKGLDPVAELVGLPICRPMLGVTEIGTMRIVQQSAFADIARSCVLGTREESCGFCSKCIRKDLISAVINEAPLEDSRVNSLKEDVSGFKGYQGNPPYYMQAQFEYCLSRLSSLSPALDNLYSRLGRPDRKDTAWMDFYYHPAQNISIPEGWRSYLGYTISEKIPMMPQSYINDVKRVSR
ncbi:DUF6395 domain-containing protein [Halomonas sp. 18H]|uniref:DUF6395 domain-containing protein n=1 Tax=Halomonas almeriensis TaxID=308163 RepID=UPI002231F2B2|nr:MULTISPECIES: DUF6395 domain-containing protein [Halomonas]MCW4152931.1 DUF6395 domain-containing protein [Halomonas sp. 18H]MDN3554258.1 DUF6395 domain-containing protein [Halomonas almeriensis]